MALLYFVIAFCASAIPLLFLLFYRWHQNRKSKIAPFTDNFLRSPGQSVNERIQSVSEEITINSNLAVILPLFIITSIFVFNFSFIYLICLIVIMVVFELFFYIKLWKHLNERRSLRLGYDGEVAVGQELNLMMLEGHHVFHDLVAEKINKFNIDHIIVGSSGVYAVETKTRSKSRTKKKNESATVIYDGNCIRFPNYSDTDSLKQARLNAVYLQKWLTRSVGESVNVEPILTIPGWYVERKSAPSGVQVLNPREIKGFLESKKEKPLSDTIVRRIVHQLDQKCRDVEPITVQVQAASST
jgi:hypothetical protein